MKNMGMGIAKPLSQSKPDRTKAKRSGVRSIEIEPAENGFTTKTRFNNEGDGYDPGDTHVHATSDDVKTYISGLFSGGDAKGRRVKAAKASMSPGMKM